MGMGFHGIFHETSWVKGFFRFLFGFSWKTIPLSVNNPGDRKSPMICGLSLW